MSTISVPALANTGLHIQTPGAENLMPMLLGEKGVMGCFSV